MPDSPHSSRLKSWGFLLTEMVLIVASILLAFALDSWWDERKDRAEEQEILQGLKEEFAGNRATLERYMSYHFQSLSGMEQLLAATERGEWQPGEFDEDQALAMLLLPPTTDFGTGVLSAIISSGRFDLLTDDDLRVKLAAWEGVFGEVQDDELMSRSLVFDRIMPYLVREGVPLGRAMALTAGIEWPLEPRSIRDDPDALGRLLTDPEFRSLLEVRYGIKKHATNEYRAATEALEEIQAAIDRSLAR